MLAFQKSFLSTCEGKLLNSLWGNFKRALHSGIGQYVPQRIITTKSSLPWITQDIKRSMRKSDHLFNKYKQYIRTADRQTHIESKHSVNKKLKDAHNRYIEEILGITSSNDSKVSEYDQEIPQSHTADQPTQTLIFRL